MSSTPPHAGVIDFNFGTDFGDFGGYFGASFGLTLILVVLSVISLSLTCLGRIREPLILRMILVDHHPMIRVVIAVNKEDGGVVVVLTNYSMSRV